MAQKKEGRTELREKTISSFGWIPFWLVMSLFSFYFANISYLVIMD